ncbi:MAG: adaptor protein MecA [Clostridia bacterium]|nr:adaptor protein MecA [Clostridia bacterium]
MNVSVVSPQKIKISLTHTEFIACFGEYEKLLNLTSKAKILLKILINDIISDNPSFSAAEKITAKIQLIKNRGCIITITALSGESESENIDCLFEFFNGDAMTDAVTAIYKNKNNRKISSHLYKTENKYQLIINCNNPKEKFFFLHEFCSDISEDISDIEYVREYGKPLILNSAINSCGRAFLKRLH